MVLSAQSRIARGSSGSATGRRHNKDVTEGSESRNGQPRTGADNVVDSGWEGKSLGNVSRGDRRLTFPNDLMGLRLFKLAIAQVIDFTADNFFATSTLAS